MPNFGPVITLAYVRILGRPPDQSGLENYNRLMNGGMTEALMRESLLRSQEYADKNPDVVAARARASGAREAGSSKKKARRRR